MSGITSGIGIFSGINTSQLIEQLLAVASRPKQYAQSRLAQLQLQQAAYLDINSKLGALKTAVTDLRVKKAFQATRADSSDSDVLSATSTTGAAAGTYRFIVDRLVSSQQLLSRGFADRDSSAVGADSFTFESAHARLDRDVSLSDLNNGDGVTRGKVVITDKSGATSTVDLSRAATVGDVIDAINANGTARVSASVRDGKFIITDTSGGTGTLRVSNATGFSTATSLGIEATSTGTAITGSSVYALNANTTLASLNDGTGVSIPSGVGASSFSINVNGTVVQVNLGDVYETVDNELVVTSGAVSTLGGAMERINDALSDAGLTTVTASVASDGARLRLVDTAGASTITVTEGTDSTAADLGLVGTTATGTLTGKRVLAGLNSTLASSLRGGQGIGGDGVLYFTARDGTNFSVTLTGDESLDEMTRAIETASGTGTNGSPRVSVTVNETGNGLSITDNTGSTTSNLFITGNSGSDTAAALGISTGGTGVGGGTGIAAAVKDSGNLQHRYLSRATQVSSLNGGAGIGTGKFRITDATGRTATVDIDSDTKSLGQLIDEINSRALDVEAEVNETGDGIIIRDTSTGGTTKIKIEDETGTVAKNLKLAGQAEGVGADNYIDGSYESTVEFDAGDTLKDIADKINAAGAGVSASIVRDGSGATPYRLSISSRSTGSAGRFVFDTGGFDLGLRSLDAGNDARVFFGSTDPSDALLLSSTTNTLDNVIDGVSIDLKTISDEAVTLTVARDDAGIEASVNLFISAFNTVVDRINSQTSYNSEANRGGPLLGDSTALQMKATLFSTVQSGARGVSGRYQRLAEIGVTVGSGGKLELDSAKLREALATDPTAVEALFTTRTAEDDSQQDLGDGITANNPNAGDSFSALGITSLIEQLTTRYLDSSDGLLTLRKRTLDDQIKAQNNRIAAFDARLEDRRAILQRQFLGMERAIGQLQSQQQALGSLG